MDRPHADLPSAVIKALLESARVSNLPTVWTNVLVGIAAAGSAWGGDPPVPIWPIPIALGSLSLLYIGGMLLNDAADAAWDAEHGKRRPITEGRISRRSVLVWAVSTLVIGASIALLATAFDLTVLVTSAVLLTAIVLYNVLHKRSAWTVLFMALCRSSVYAVSAAVAFGVVDDTVDRAGTSAVMESVSPPALAIFAYTALLTLAARREDIAGARVGGLWAWLMPMPCIVAAIAYRPERLLWTIFAGAAFFVWTLVCARRARDGKIPQAVSGWLAGSCLADATLLMLMNRLDLAAVAVGCWLLTLVGQRTISGT